jgi:hypothetical protein
MNGLYFAAYDIVCLLHEFFNAYVRYLVEFCVTVYLARRVHAQGLMPGHSSMR